MSNVKFYIKSNNISYQEVTPVWDGNIKWSKKEGQVFFRKEIAKDLVFKSADFTLLISTLSNPFEVVKVEIYRECNQADNLYHIAEFALLNCKIDYDKSTISVTPESIDDYQCRIEQFKEEVNFHQSSTEIGANPFQGSYELQNLWTNGTTANHPYTGFPIGNLGIGWWVKNNSTEYSGSGDNLIFRTFWHRLIAVGVNGTQPPPFGTSWVLVNPNDNIWAKEPENSDYSIKPLFSGRKFNEALIYIFNSAAKCPLNIISNYFNINPDGSANSNDYYIWAKQNLWDLQIHQKSDVKRPSATNKSSSLVWKMKPQELLEDLRKMFNVYWAIEGDTIRIEHLSYFKQNNIILLENYAFKNQIAYESGDSIPKSETWNWSDAFQDYCGVYYENGNEGKEYRCTYFNNHLSSIQIDQYKDKISDDGFTLVATVFANGGWFLKGVDTLYWSNLLENCHTYGRYFESGYVGNGISSGTFTNFKNSVMIKKQPKFTIKNPCDDTFNPKNQFQTPLGIGSIDVAVENIMLDNVEIELKY